MRNLKRKANFIPPDEYEFIGKRPVMKFIISLLGGIGIFYLFNYGGARERQI